MCPHLALWDLGAQALRLIKDIGRRANLFVPPALTHESSWATMIITSFLRSAIKLISSKFVNVLQFSSGIISLMIYFNSLLMPSRVVRMSMLWIMEIWMVPLLLKCGRHSLSPCWVGRLPTDHCLLPWLCKLLLLPFPVLFIIIIQTPPSARHFPVPC